MCAMRMVEYSSLARKRRPAECRGAGRGGKMLPPALNVERITSRESRVLMFVDIVESARLLQADERGITARWLDFIAYVQSDIFSVCHARLIKELGDGLL